jgi:predicted NAD-dependent protein-ADP-ribosyltransferase YbiA (DUF1768 family)
MTTDPTLAERIRTQPSARAARTEAGSRRAYQRQDWFDVNIEVMDVVLHAKFTQHADLRGKLLGTGNRELIEDSPVRVLPYFRTMQFFGGLNTRTGRHVLGNRKGWPGPE